MSLSAVLVVEDDPNKLEQVCSVLKSIGTLQVETARSYHSALECMLARKFGIVLLDMTLPTFDITESESGGETRHFGGRELLRQLQRRDLRLPVLVVTQFVSFGKGHHLRTLRQLDAELRREHPECYLGYVYYDAKADGWQEALADRVRSVVLDKKE